MNFFFFFLYALILFSLPSSVYALDSNSIPEYLMAKALVANYAYFCDYIFPFLQETNLSEREKRVVSCFYEVISKSEIGVSSNDDLSSIYGEIRRLYMTINDIIVKCFNYVHQGSLNDIINDEMSMDSLSDAGLNLLKNLSNSTFIDSEARVRALTFDKAIFKSLMQTSPDIWLSYMCDKCKSENDNDNYYDKIKQIFDYQYNYLNYNPNYLTEQ